MSGIIINTSFANPDLPTALSLEQQIKAIPELEMWVQADARHISLSGSEITEFRDVAGGDGVFTRIDTDKSALITDSALGGYSVADFEDYPDETDRYTSTGISLPEDAPYSYVLVYKSNDTTVEKTIFGRYNGATARSLFGTSTTWNPGRFFHGSGTMYLAPSKTAWNLVIVSFNGTHLNAEVNGVAAPAVAAAGATGDAFILGGHADLTAFDGQLADALVFSKDIIGGGEIDLVREHFTKLYGTFPIA